MTSAKMCWKLEPQQELLRRILTLEIVAFGATSPEAPDECKNVLETRVTEPIAQSACLRGEVDTNKHQRKCAQNSSHSAYGLWR